ncbi:related to EMI1 Protein required for transcriptional induction of the early meiotic-specific transcription factor IME1, also required for sporulation [Rhynchosporium secalis]|uniref:Related to EMI1 Protein required for transcriptional induction of the early meiotic-specific transcription factor IME1, also required for sporulation n=1 Tax=Rhynchosporium secalis TaxID=38038 RepID=A0A1E1LV22_RHYSE|nr:related to EMI1 Protein required for transcriptional induction of the early meiotic-specific transcription factor IME1, also required for sporulation [Rhynchosporium secalis]
MGWLWSTPSSDSSSAKESSNPAQSQPSKPQQSNSSPAQTTKAVSQEDPAEQELTSFLRELSADTQTSSTKYNRVAKNPPTSTPNLPSKPQSQSFTPQNTDATLHPLAEELLPTTMSCRTAFDEAFYCNSFGGRWNDLYRYGTLKSCSDNWSDFWFCMRTRTYGDAQKEKAIKEHYRQRESAKYSKELGRESSEDVWRSREGKVAVGEAFRAPFEKFAGTDEEWRERELEMRRGRVEENVGW